MGCCLELQVRAKSQHSRSYGTWTTRFEQHTMAEAQGPSCHNNKLFKQDLAVQWTSLACKDVPLIHWADVARGAQPNWELPEPTPGLHHT